MPRQRRHRAAERKGNLQGDFTDVPSDSTAQQIVETQDASGNTEVVLKEDLMLKKDYIRMQEKLQTELVALQHQNQVSADRAREDQILIEDLRRQNSRNLQLQEEVCELKEKQKVLADEFRFEKYINQYHEKAQEQLAERNEDLLIQITSLKREISSYKEMMTLNKSMAEENNTLKEQTKQLQEENCELKEKQKVLVDELLSEKDKNQSDQKAQEQLSVSHKELTERNEEQLIEIRCLKLKLSSYKEKISSFKEKIKQEEELNQVKAKEIKNLKKEAEETKQLYEVWDVSGLQKILIEELQAEVDRYRCQEKEQEQLSASHKEPTEPNEEQLVEITAQKREISSDQQGMIEEKELDKDLAEELKALEEEAAEKERLQEEISQLKVELKVAEAVQAEKKKNQCLEKAQEQLSVSLKELTERNEEQLKEIRSLKREISSFKEKMTEGEKLNKDMAEEIKILKEEAEDTKRKQKADYDELQAEKKKNQCHEEAQEQLSVSLKELTEHNEEQLKEIRSLKREISSYQQRMTEGEKLNKDMAEEIKTLKVENADTKRLQEEVWDLTETHKGLQEELRSEVYKNICHQKAQEQEITSLKREISSYKERMNEGEKLDRSMAEGNRTLEERSDLRYLKEVPPSSQEETETEPCQQEELLPELPTAPVSSVRPSAWKRSRHALGLRKPQWLKRRE